MAALDPRQYSIAWIAPLEIEAIAATHMLDHKHHGRFSLDRGDDYVFIPGDIFGHNVIIATYPSGQEYGTGTAAALASQVKKFFPNLWFGLLVGVAAGLPTYGGSSPRDIRLGDVLVALPEGETAGLIAYDLGKETARGFQLLRGGHALAMAEPVVRSAIGSIKREFPNEAQEFLPYYERMKDRQHEKGTFQDPGQEYDILHEANDAQQEKIVQRDDRPPDRRTRVWYGPIGSGDKLMKNSAVRNKLRDDYQLIGLEMEAAGTMNRLAAGVIRGVCDYGDEHKNKVWQPYAAAMAAAYAKAVLAQIGPRNPHVHETIEHNSRQICQIPFSRNKNFTGRKSQIKKLWQMFFVEERERVALVGLGGMGKTQIALELAHLVKHTLPQYSVFWMPAQSTLAFQKAATELVHKLGIPVTEGDDLTDALQTYLSSETTGHWLLILDNADDMSVFQRPPSNSPSLHILPRSQTGRILITTRSPSIVVNVAGIDVIELEEMTQNDAIELLGTSLTDKNQLKQTKVIEELLQQLTYLPLTVAQAAAYMNMNKMPVANYLQLFTHTDQGMIKLLSVHLRDETHYSDAQGAVATTWIISFQSICQMSKTAAQLLSFIQWIEPKAIPRTILPNLGSDWDFEQAIGLLCGYSFMSWRDDGETLDMHRLVHLSLKTWSGQLNNVSLTYEDIIQHLCTIFPNDDWENRLIWRQFIPHILPLLRNNRFKSYLPASRLGHRVSCCLNRDRRIREQIDVLRLVTAVHGKSLGEDHPDRLASQHELAGAYEANGQIEQAVQLLEHVVAIRGKSLAEDHPDRLASQHGLALVFQANGQVEQAVQLLEYVVAIEGKSLAEDHPDRLASQHALAGAFQANGQVEQAVQLLEHVVAIRGKSLAEDHPDRLASQHELALVFQANGQVEQAVQLLEYVVAIEGKSLAEDHPDRLASQHELARAFQANNQVKQAVQLLEHIVAIEGNSLAEDHPDRLASQHELARAFQTNGQVKQAVQLLQHVVAIRGKSQAEDHPDRLASQHTLAGAYKANGQIKQAVQLLEHVVAIRGKSQAEDHPDRLASQHMLAGAYKANGQIKQAVQLLEHVVVIRGKSLAEDHPNRLSSQHTLAGAYKANGQIKQAVQLLEHVVAIRGKSQAEDHPNRLASQHTLAGAYEANGQVKQAVQLLQHVVAIRGKSLAEEHPDRLASQRLLFIIRQGRGCVRVSRKRHNPYPP
ncbi:hypothetical protein QQS21_002454 [Conoideocrella luteorostrata]|uniref:NB-ARC domain-containing protein n=1 Tax=Conoideocrella luteorostrata TaxID=1105319 RepID=A0AAJ0G1A7_9HYPO|nr:hypothetical protein QQS21_002454 [Conoideocrella luteorostrata]